MQMPVELPHGMLFGFSLQFPPPHSLQSPSHARLQQIVSTQCPFAHSPS
jgi:hypothetical protein